jgi:ATP-dependent Clp protease ATP-binding subunit ClpA
LACTGKTYLSTQLANALLPESHVHRFHGTMYSHTHLALQYQQELQAKILEELRICPYSIFSIEEVHFMAPSVLNDLVHFFHNNAIINGVDARQAIFILTTNIGGKALQEIAYSAAVEGKQLTQVPYKTIAAKMTEELNNKDSLRLLIKDGVIDRHIPFFPLVKSHVKQCIDLQLHRRKHMLRERKQLKSLEWDLNVVEYAAAQLTYVGPISELGCRPVDSIITTDLLPTFFRESKLIENPSGLQKYFGIMIWNTKKSVVKLQVVKDKNGKEQVEAMFTPKPIQPAADAGENIISEFLRRLLD